MPGFVLPSYSAPGQGWQLTDYKPSLTLTATADPTGVATVTANPVEPGYMWSIQRAVVSSTSASASTLRLYDGTPSPGNLLSGSDHGNYDEADYPAGLLVDQSRQVTAQWVNADPGAICTLRLQVAVLGLVAAS